MDNSSLCYIALCDFVRSVPAVFLLRLMPGAAIRIPAEDHDHYYVYAGHQAHLKSGEGLMEMTHIDTQWCMQTDYDNTDLQLTNAGAQQIVICSRTIDIGSFQKDFYVYDDQKIFSAEMRRRVHDTSKHLLKSIPVEVLSQMVSPVVFRYPVTEICDDTVLTRYPLYSQWDFRWMPDAKKLKYHIVTYCLKCFANELIKYCESTGARSW